MTPPTRGPTKSPPRAPRPASGAGEFLRHMVATVEEELQAGLYARRLSREDLPTGPRPRLVETLRRAPQVPALLVELKHASPGRADGRLAALPPDRFVRVCEEAGASALSVIPQPFAFGGSLEEFGKVAKIAKLPVLFKDFVIDERQLDAARSHGASAVLLLARLARSRSLHAPLKDLVRASHDRGLETVVEVHREPELRVALESGTDVLGVNARDLDSMRLEPHAAVPLLRALRKDPRPLVAMSGVEGPREIELYAGAGADAVLVGTAFSRSKDPSEFLRGLRRTTRGLLTREGG